MADNVVLDPGTGGATIHTDELTAGTYQMGCSKIIFGTSGNNDAYWSAGAGAVGTGVGRVTLASDDPAVALLTTIETNTDFGTAVGGGTEAAALRVTLANDSTGVVTVDGTVTANPASGTIDTVTTVGTVTTCNLAAETTKVIGTVNVAAGQTIAATNAGTFAVQAAQSGTWNVTNISGTVSLPTGAATEATLTTIDTDTGNIAAGFATEGSALGSGVLLQGDDGTDRTNVLVDTAGHLQVDVLSGGGGGTQYTEDDAAAANPVGTTPVLVRQDTPSSEVTTNGDVIAQRSTAYGAAYVQILDSSGNFINTFGGSGGTSATDDTAFTAGSGAGTPAMGFFSADTVNAGDVGVLAMDASRRLLCSIEVDNVGIGGGTQYTEDAAAAANPVGNAMMVIREDARAGSLTTTDGDNVALRGNNSGELYTIDTDANALLTTIDSDTSFIRNSYGIAGTAGTSVNTVQGIAGMVPVVVDLGANNDVTVTSGTITAVTDITNPITANPASGTIDTVTTVSTVTNLAQMGGQAISLNTGVRDAGTQRVTIATNDSVPVTGTVTANPASGTIDTVTTVTTCNLADETTKVIGTVNVAAGQTIATTNAGTFAVQSTLQTGSNAIGKLAANSGVDIGDVDVTSISAGSNLIGDVGIQGRTTGGLSIFYDNDLDETAVVVKAGAGTLYSLHVINTTAAPLYLQLFNVAQGSVTVGTTTPTVQFVIPANADSDGAGFTLSVPQGIAFGTAITAAASTGSETAGAPGANACHCNLFYK